MGRSEGVEDEPPEEDSGEGRGRNAAQESPLPELPDIPRRLRFAALQAIGIPILLVLPVLTLLGVLDHRSDRNELRTASWWVSYEVPARLLYGDIGRLLVRIRNEADHARAITVSFDLDYLAGFLDVSSTPSVDALGSTKTVLAGSRRKRHGPPRVQSRRDRDPSR